MAILRISTQSTQIFHQSKTQFTAVNVKLGAPVRRTAQKMLPVEETKGKRRERIIRFIVIVKRLIIAPLRILTFSAIRVSIMCHVTRGETVLQLMLVL